MTKLHKKTILENNELRTKFGKELESKNMEISKMQIELQKYKDQIKELEEILKEKNEENEVLKQKMNELTSITQTIHSLINPLSVNKQL